MKIFNIFKRPSTQLPDHQAIRQADPYGYETYQLKLAWLFRMSFMTNIVLLVVVLMLIGSFNAVLPLKEIRVALLRADPSDNRIYRIEPIRQGVDGFDLVLEVKAKEFVHKLLTIDIVTQQNFINDAMKMAAPPFAVKFKQDRLSAIQKLLNQGIKRHIDIVSVDHLNSLQPSIYKLVVDFVQTDFSSNGKQLQRKSLRAYVAMTTAIKEVPEAQKYENPLGIRVEDMTIQTRKEDQNFNNQDQVNVQ